MSEPLKEVPTVDQILTDPGLVQDLPVPVVQHLLIQVTALLPLLVSRSHSAPEKTPEDRILRIKEASIILGTTVDHLYRHHDKYPFAFKDGDSLRFSWLGIQKWIRARQRHG